MGRAENEVADLACRRRGSFVETAGDQEARSDAGSPGALGEAATAAARTDTFLGARYRHIVKRRGHAKALVAVARSILVIAWHLINDPDASYQELGADWHRRHLAPARKTRDLVTVASASA
ncbi:hypothetical protein [Streptomyces sp. NPDC001100]